MCHMCASCIKEKGEAVYVYNLLNFYLLHLICLCHVYKLKVKKVQIE